MKYLILFLTAITACGQQFGYSLYKTNNIGAELLSDWPPGSYELTATNAVEDPKLEIDVVKAGTPVTFTFNHVMSDTNNTAVGIKAVHESGLPVGTHTLFVSAYDPVLGMHSEPSDSIDARARLGPPPPWNFRMSGFSAKVTVEAVETGSEQ